MERSEFSVKGAGNKYNTEEDVRSICQQLDSQCGTLRSICLSGNTIGIEAAHALARELVKLKSLEAAYLDDIFTGRLASEIPEALEALLGALAQLPHLHTLDLSDNAFGPTAQEPLIKFLSAHVPLRHLYLQNNGLGPQAGARIAAALHELAQRKRKVGADAYMLETVICGRNRLEDGSMAEWARALAAHAQSLHTVRMVQNGIRPAGVEALLRDGLASCRELRELDLQDNTFTHRGAAQLAGCVAGWPRLRELAVSDCLLSARGSRALVEALSQGGNTVLEVLRLQYNEMEADGLASLAGAMANAANMLPALMQLELNGNRFDDDDAAVDTIRDVLDQRGGELDELDDLEDVTSDEESEGEFSERDEEDDGENSVAERERVEHEAEALADALERVSA